MNYLYVALAAMFLLVGVEKFGEHRIQSMWDIERAILEDKAKQAEFDDAKIRNAIEVQHRKDIQNAKSESGRIAIRGFLRARSMLPDHTAKRCQADSAEGADGSTGESRTGDGLEKFANRCGQDALKVLAWQEWAMRQGLAVE